MPRVSCHILSFPSRNLTTRALLSLSPRGARWADSACRTLAWQYEVRAGRRRRRATPLRCSCVRSLTTLGALCRPVQTKDEKKAALAAKRDARKAAKGGDGSASATPSGSTADLASLSLETAETPKDKHAAFRTVTGVLTSRPTSRDIKIDGFSMTLNGSNLIQDCSIELTIGRRCVAASGHREWAAGRCQQRRPGVTVAAKASGGSGHTGDKRTRGSFAGVPLHAASATSVCCCRAVRVWQWCDPG